MNIAGLTVEPPEQTLSLKPHETREVQVQISGDHAADDNNYRLLASFDAGNDGLKKHAELMHVNCIARRTITVDGKGDKENGAGNSSGMDSPVSEMMESDLFIGACQIRHKPGCQHPRWSPRSDVRARLTTKPVLSTTAFRLTP